jgi:hypothetical protein
VLCIARRGVEIYPASDQEKAVQTDEVGEGATVDLPHRKVGAIPTLKEFATSITARVRRMKSDSEDTLLDAHHPALESAAQTCSC